ncbi:MAG TPA: suppressor of fused domain protein [Candidatus Limnocylindrales bacterium]|nr:suppressor of fused domain protein [Candidatus Limnocylindrales bacterium]
MDDAAAGWEAINAALDGLYPGVQPKHYGTVMKWAFGGPDPLDGLSVYARDDHWHFVTYGMSELYDKESDDPDRSGWGFEFTFRPGRDPSDPSGSEPPMWAANFLQNLARYVFTTANAFGPGHHMDLNGPISLAEPDTAIRAVAFADDPELGEIDTPHGRLRFLQVVGLTLDEYAAVEGWDTTRLLEAMTPRLPLLVTDLKRGSLTDDPAVSAAIEEGARRDGSSTASLYVEEASFQDGRITFGASAAPRIARVLAGRLPFDRGLLVDAREGSLGLRPAPDGEFRIDQSRDGFTEFYLPPAAATELIGVLRPVAGSYSLAAAPGLVVEIVKSRIRDQSGAVVAEIG